MKCLHLLLSLAFLSGIACPLLQAQNLTISSRVAAGDDDAEENGSNALVGAGNINLSSGDLELSYDSPITGDQWVGLRFANITIPQGATIVNAYVQFTVDETDNAAGTQIIRGQATDDAFHFNSTAFDISSRPATASQVTWSNIPQWIVVGDAGAGQRTPNLSPILQEIINRPGWASGNAVVITLNGTGQRIARSYDGDSQTAAELVIEFSTTVLPIVNFPVVAEGYWKYDDSGVFPGNSWKTAAFNDAAWPIGLAPLGYGNGDEATTLSYGPNPNNKYPAYYFRKTFNVANPALYDTLLVRLRRDDGGVVYINGVEVFRQNMPNGVINYNTLASSTMNGADEYTYFPVYVASNLIAGTNLVAVEVHQSNVTSSDLAFDLEVLPDPGPLPTGVFPIIQGADWAYLDGGQSLDAVNWKDTVYSIDAWNWGAAPLGYGDPVSTEVGYGADANNKHITTYFRRDFEIANLAALPDSLLLSVRRDDGVIVYLNGNEVYRNNMPAGNINYQTLATNTIGGADEEAYNGISFSSSQLRLGRNVLAAEIHQVDPTSSDIVFDCALGAVPVPNPPAMGCANGNLTHIGCFTSVVPTDQEPYLVLPSTHRFQFLFQQSDPYMTGGGVAPGSNDFTGYIPRNGNSGLGYVSVNHETVPGGVSMLSVHYDTLNRYWDLTNSDAVDFSGVGYTAANCSGNVTPWETVITCEETAPGVDLTGDGYEDLGWCVEIIPGTAAVADYGTGSMQKLWAMGNMAHENCVVANDQTTVYFGEDGGTQCVYKFIADQPGNLTSGQLFVLVLDAPLQNNEPISSTGTWVQVPNTTQVERNQTNQLASALGGDNFDGVEDVEISPIDGKIYFASKGKGRIYRFTDNGTTFSNFETFVGGTSYQLNTSGGLFNEAWGGGNDNLAFDDLGNLWVCQDGGRDHIWMVRPDHTQLAPKVELFATTPFGSEPTGITFTPDHRFMFISFQHPDGANLPQTDAAGVAKPFNKGTTVVIARAEFLGEPVAIEETAGRGATTRIFPNPAREVINVEFEMLQNGEATIELFDVLGRTIQKVVLADLPIGAHRHPLLLEGLGLGGSTLGVFVRTPQGVQTFKVQIVR